jgi:Sugar kinases, ribokinase family
LPPQKVVDTNGAGDAFVGGEFTRKRKCTVQPCTYVNESHIHYSGTAVTIHVVNWCQIYMKSCLFRPVMFAFKMQSSGMLGPADL